MKSLFTKMKTYDFWVKLAAAIVLLVQIVGNKFGLEIDSMIFMDIITAVAGILVVLGIISAPTILKVKGGKDLENTENLDFNGDGQEDEAVFVEDDVTADEQLEAMESSAKDDEAEVNEEETFPSTEAQGLETTGKTLSVDADTEDCTLEAEISLGGEVKTESGEETSPCAVAPQDALTVTASENGAFASFESAFDRVVSRIDALLTKLEEL